MEHATHTVKGELKELLSLASGIVLSLLCQIALGITNSAFVGHYMGNTEFAAVGLSSSLINLFGTSVGYGLASTMDTLCTQGFGGSNKMLVGRTLQRGFLILGIALLPCISLLLHAETILQVLSIDPRVAALCGRYVMLTLPGLPFLFLSCLLERYLQTQDIVMPTFWANVITVAFNALSNYILVAVLSMGLDGSAVAVILADAISPLMLAAYIFWSKVYIPTWPRWSFAVLLEWGVFIRLGIAGMLMIGVEWWLYEILQFIAGLIGTAALDTQVAVYQFAVFVFMLPYGIGEASSTRVGNWLGASEPKMARTAAFLGIACTLFESLAVAGIVLGLRHYIPAAITNDQETIDMAADVLRWIATFHVFDSTQGVCSGILRGCGLQTIGVVLNVVGLYVVGLPVGIALAFSAGWGVSGLWAGMGTGAFTQMCGYLFVVSRISWDEQVRLALERCEDGETKLAEEMGSVNTPSPAPSPEPPAQDELESSPLLGVRLDRSRIILARVAALGIFASILLVSVIVRVYVTPEPYCYPAPHVTHGDPCTSALLDHTCKVACDSGYVLNGTLTCTALGSWAGQPHCIRADPQRNVSRAW